MVRCCVRLSVCRLSVTYVFRLNGTSYRKKLSKEADKVARPLPCGKNSTPFPQTGVLTPPPNICIANCGHTASVSAMVRPTIDTLYELTNALSNGTIADPYVHLFSQNRSPDPPQRYCMLPDTTVGYTSASWAS